MYSTSRWLQFYWLYIIILPLQLVIASIVICPLLIWNDIVYLPNEYYCFVPFNCIRGMLWLTVNIYVIPLILLTIIYTRIIIFIRRRLNNQSILIKRKQERDLLAIKRIIITNTCLNILALPILVLVIISFINDVDPSIYHRIKICTYGVSMAILSLQTAFLTPQVKDILLKRWKHNQVAPIRVHTVCSIPTKHMTNMK